MIFYLLIFICYAILTIYTCIRIAKSVTLSRNQKIANCIINSLIPFIWFLLIKPVIFQKVKVMTLEERKKLSANEPANTSLPTVYSDGI